MTEKKFEEAMQRLEQIVQTLERGEIALEGALEAFEEGMQLIKFCTGKLEEAERKVTLLIRESGGKLTREPFEPDGKEDVG